MSVKTEPGSAERIYEAWVLVQREFHPEILRTEFVRLIWQTAFRAGVIEGGMAALTHPDDVAPT